MKTDFHSLTERLERVYTPRVAFRHLALADAWPLYDATRDPRFNLGLMWDQPGDDTAVLARVDAIVSAARRGLLTAVSAVMKGTGEWISLYRFQPYSADPRLVEMGIWTHKKFWHGQFSLELARACIDAAFSVTDIPLLIGAAYPTNPRSCKLLELCGLSPTKVVSRRKESGVEVELQEFEVHRAQWASARRAPEFSEVAVRAPAYPVPSPEGNSPTNTGLALQREAAEHLT